MECHCPNFDLMRHILVTGSTGSGKTLSVVLPLLKRAIFESADRKLAKPALVVVDVKGDLTSPVKRMLAACGREEDLLEVSLESGHGTDLLSWLCFDPHTGGKLLMDANWGRVGKSSIGSDNGYWEIGAVGYISSAIAWLQFLGKAKSVSHLSELLLTEEAYWEFNDNTHFPVVNRRKVVKALLSSSVLKDKQLGILLDRLIQLHLKTDLKTRNIFTSVIAQGLEALAHPISGLITSDQPDVPPQPTMDRSNPNTRLKLDSKDLAQLSIGEFYVAEGERSYFWKALLEPSQSNEDIRIPERGKTVPHWTELVGVPLDSGLFQSLDKDLKETAARPVAGPDSQTPMEESEPSVVKQNERKPGPVVRPTWMNRFSKTMDAGEEERS